MNRYIFLLLFVLVHVLTQAQCKTMQEIQSIDSLHEGKFSYLFNSYIETYYNSYGEFPKDKSFLLKDLYKRIQIVDSTYYALYAILEPDIEHFDFRTIGDTCIITVCNENYIAEFASNSMYKKSCCFFDADGLFEYSEKLDEAIQSKLLQAYDRLYTYEYLERYLEFYWCLPLYETVICKWDKATGFTMGEDTSRIDSSIMMEIDSLLNSCSRISSATIPIKIPRSIESKNYIDANLLNNFIESCNVPVQDVLEILSQYKIKYSNGGYITDINLFKKELAKKNINLSSQLLNKFDSLNFNINQDRRLIVSINGVTILIVEPYDDEYVPFDASM